MDAAIKIDDEGNCYFETTFHLKYNTRLKPTVDDVINSLHNIEMILKRTPAFMELQLKGANIIRADVFVSSIQEGSLIEDFIVKYVIPKEKYEKLKDAIDDIVGNTPVIRTTTAMAVAALVTYGAMKATGDDAKTKPQTDTYNINVINVGEGVGIDGKDIATILDKISDKKALAKEAVGVVQPIKRDPTGSILISEANALEMSPAVISEVPESYTPPEQQEREVKHANIDIFIFASDRDKREQGWAGIVPDLFERRLKFTLGENVNPDELHGYRRVKADIVVHERFMASKKKYEPQSVEIVTVAYK